MNVLIVEDDQTEARFIRRILSNVMSEATCLDHVIRLSDAIDRLASRPFDVVLLNLQLPDSVGLDTFVKLSSAYPALPIIVLTDTDDEKSAIEALRHGAQDYLVKGDLQEVTLCRALRFAVERGRRLRAEQRVFEAQESERKRLSRELHDGVLQSLHSIRLRLQMLAGKPQSNDRNTSKCLTEMAEVTLGAIDEVKRVCRDLHPAILERRDLGDALILFGKRVHAESGVAIKVFDRCRGELSWQMKRHLYRICQEAVRNAVRHSGTKTVTVEYGTQDDMLVLEVRDEGKGFDVASAARLGGGLGMASISERARILNGQAFIHSRPNEGTVVRVEFPDGCDFLPSHSQRDITGDEMERVTGRATLAASAGDTVCEGPVTKIQVPEVNDADPRHVGR